MRALSEKELNKISTWLPHGKTYTENQIHRARISARLSDIENELDFPSGLSKFGLIDGAVLGVGISLAGVEGALVAGLIITISQGMRLLKDKFIEKKLIDELDNPKNPNYRPNK